MPCSLLMGTRLIYVWSTSCSLSTHWGDKTKTESGNAAPTLKHWLEGSRCGIWRRSMLWTIFVLLMILWLLGMVSSYTLGGFIHILLIFALVTVLIRIIQGRNPI